MGKCCLSSPLLPGLGWLTSLPEPCLFPESARSSRGGILRLTQREARETKQSVMKKALLALAVASSSFILAASPASAENAYAGTYDVILAYTTGPSIGKFGSTLRPGLGVASVSKKGRLVASLFWPADGSTQLLRGTVGNNGVFRFTTLNARLKLVEDKLGMVEFTDPQQNKGFIIVRQKN